MSAPAKTAADQSSDVSSADKGEGATVTQGATLSSFLAAAGNRTVHTLISGEGAADRSASGIYTLGNSIAFAPARFPFGTVDSLGPYGDSVVDSVATAVSLGNTLTRRLVTAALRGFLSEARTQLVDKGKAQQFNRRLDELAQPGTVAAFAGGLLSGIPAGFVTPVTDMFGLPAFADAVLTFVRGAANSVLRNAPALLQKGNEIVAGFYTLQNELTSAAMEVSMNMVRDPNYLSKLSESAGDAAAEMAGQAGHSAAITALHLLESGEEDEEDPGWASVLPKEISDPGWALMATASRAWEYGTERAKKALFTTGSSRAGYAIAHVIGMVVANVLLFLFTKGVGNAISAIGRASSRLAPALRTVGTLVTKLSKALEVVGVAVEAVEAGIAVVAEAALKPFARVLRPFGELLGRLQAWLRELLGLAEREGPEAAAAASATLAGKQPHLSGGTAEAKQVAAQGATIEEPPTALRGSEPVAPSGETPVTTDPSAAKGLAETKAAPASEGSGLGQEPAATSSTTTAPPHDSSLTPEPLRHPAVERQLKLEAESKARQELIKQEIQTLDREDAALHVQARDLRRQWENEYKAGRPTQDIKAQLQEVQAEAERVQFDKRRASARLENEVRAAEGITPQLRDQLRKGTPGPEVRKRTLERARGDKPLGTDEVFGTKETATNPLEPDHIVPFDEIVDMEGFNRLPLEHQREVLDLEENLVAMNKSANASKQHRRWRDWNGWRLFTDDVRVQTKMIQTETRLRTRIQLEIQTRIKRLGL